MFSETAGNLPFRGVYNRRPTLPIVKAYFDANIYVSYLLGQTNCEIIDKIFKEGIKCKFSIVASTTIFREIANACEGCGLMLLQTHIDSFKAAGKLQIISESNEENRLAIELDEKTCHEYGENDCRHLIVAKKYADIFVTDDAKLQKLAAASARACTSRKFLSEL